MTDLRFFLNPNIGISELLLTNQGIKNFYLCFFICLVGNCYLCFIQCKIMQGLFLLAFKFNMMGQGHLNF